MKRLIALGVSVILCAELVALSLHDRRLVLWAAGAAVLFALVNVRQVLQVNEFYRAEIGKWTRADVLVNFGRPVETSYFPLMQREVWTYRYQEDNVWYMLYSFYFDHDGILRLMQKTPDPLHDPDARNRF